MVDRAPDLVARAAARLRRSPSQQPEIFPPVTTGFSVDPVTSPAVPRTMVQSFADASSNKAGPEDRSRDPAAVISQTSLAAQGIVLPSAGTSRTVEEFRALKRELLATIARNRGAASGPRSRVVLVTSASPGEGKTFTATNLALALAYEKDVRVLLMDADAYRQSLLSYLGITAEMGWLDYVSGLVPRASDVIVRTNLPNFSVLPAGKVREQIPELMSSSRTAELLDELTLEDPARTVVIDAVPCLTSTEPSILAGLAGQTIFVVAAHETAQDQIEASLRQLSASSSVSLMLNKMHPALADHFKGYGYSYGAQR